MNRTLVSLENPSLLYRGFFVSPILLPVVARESGIDTKKRYQRRL